MQKIIDKYQETFAGDRKIGLLHQVLRSLYTKNIQRHTQTYLTKSIKDVTKSVQAESTDALEQDLLGMVPFPLTRKIDQGEIFASINQKDGMILFKEADESYSTEDMARVLDARIKLAMSVGKKVRQLDEAIHASPQYLEKQLEKERSQRPGGIEVQDDFGEAGLGHSIPLGF